MKSACKPLHVQQSSDDFGVQVVSTSPAEEKQMRVSMQLFTIDGGLAASKEWRVDVPADTTAQVGFLPECVKDGRLYFHGLTPGTQGGEEIDRSVTWIQKDCKWQDLLKVPPTKVSLALTGKSHKDGETTYKLAVPNTGNTPAVHARLSLLLEDRGDEVLPSVWSDNAMTLLPKETKQLTVTCRDSLLAGAEPHVMFEGWNIVPSQHRLSDGKQTDLAVEVVKIEPDYKEGVVTIEARPRQPSPKQSRIPTWPFLILLNGKPVRTAKLGIGSAASKAGVSSAVVHLEGIGPADQVTVL